MVVERCGTPNDGLDKADTMVMEIGREGGRARTSHMSQRSSLVFN